MVSTVWVNVDNRRDHHPLADHMTKLRNFTKEENHDFATAAQTSWHVAVDNR